MSFDASVSDIPAHVRWRAALELSPNLVRIAQRGVEDSARSQSVIAGMREQVVTTLGNLFVARAQLWLSHHVIRHLGRQSLERAGQQPHPEDFAMELSALMRQALELRQTRCAASGEAPLSWSSDAVENNLPCAVAVLLIPIHGDGDEASPLGVIQLERPAESPLNPQEIEFLEGVASQVALALQAALQLLTERWRLEQLHLVRQVSTQIASERNLDKLTQRVASLIWETFNYYYVAIFTVEEGKNILHFRASAGPARPSLKAPPSAVYSPSLEVHLGEGIIGHVASTGQEVLADDVARSDLYQHLDILPETRSELALPLKIEDRLLGVLDVQSDQTGYFDETDLLILRALAGNIATAVEGARLYSALDRRAAQLAAIYEVSNAITSILDQEKLLQEVAELIQRRFGYPYVHLFTVHPGRRKIFYEAGTGEGSQQLHQQGYALNLDDEKGLIPWVARNGQTMLVNNVDFEPLYRPSPLPPAETRSELVAPLIFGGQVLGILDVESDTYDAFTEDDRFLFEALADNIAIAMRNAFLYRSEQWRRQVADSLKEVASLLSADLGQAQLISAILAELERTLPLDLAAIWLLEESALNGENLNAPVLYLAALRGPSAASLDLEIGLRVEDVLALNPIDKPTTPDAELQPAANLASEATVSWLRNVLNSTEPIIRQLGSPFDPLGAALRYPSDYSAIAAPLRVGDSPLGVLILAHHTAGRYGSEAQAMTSAFASYAAVAIQNARLYEAAHERAWVSNVLLEVAEAAQSQSTLQGLLDFIIRILPTLVGVKAGMLYLLDDDGIFIPAVASGLTSSQQRQFERWRFAPGDVPALDKLMLTMSPLILHGDEMDRRLTSILTSADEEKGSSHAGILALTPLVARGEVLGALLIDYSPDLLGEVTSKSIEEAFEDTLAIVQGIAHQTAIALDNMRLLRLQKEDAYVSVALLQAAQAVVSSNDLDEILGSIVRITPILVGAQRTAIYLWDANQASFRLAQAYGIPTEFQIRQLQLGDFPLLDAVVQRNTLLTCPVEPHVRDARDVLRAWINLPVPEADADASALGSEACLLLAFPLAVKGQVLGILLVEEPPPMSLDQFGLGPSNQRAREKRLEIITGISQQAALAIQNDLLQRETLERERLEREMQLARDIQRAFLPQSLPDLPGWEMDVCWRTARLVGGDFYDYFELPGKRIGLVVADVADKGMPAALFMVLARTLLRAAVQRATSPAHALERVNEILAPDAPQGMFVTVVYAVLSLESGDLEYAIAGHNPPYLLRSREGKLESLQKGGIALGVLEQIHLAAHHLHLEPGDYLVMFTDGVTETFSVEGELFGEEGLQQALESAINRAQQIQDEGISAQALMESINRSVAAFMGDALPSDDLTMLIMRRKG